MTSSRSTVSAPVTRSRFRARVRGIAPAAIAAVTALAVVVGSTLRDSVSVSGPEGLRRVGFGVPADWVLQNQATLDPPFPYRAIPLDDHEFVTDLSWGALAVDWLLALVVVLACWVLLRAVRRRMRRRAA